MKHSKIATYVECAIMIALGTVLSMLPLVEMPYGGSITVASMLPLVILSYRNGTKYGLISGALYAVLQLLLGLKNLSYVTTWYSVLAVIFLDYIIAFTLIGGAGIVRRFVKGGANALFLGSLLCSLLRYISHVIAGATVWAGISIPTGATLVYSIGYNATYMLPETIILTLCAFYIGNTVDFSTKTPTRVVKKSASSTKTFVFGALSGFSLLVGLVTDVCLIFPKFQMPDGSFSFAAIGSVSWLAVAIVSGVSLLLFALFVALYIYQDRSEQKQDASLSGTQN